MKRNLVICIIAFALSVGSFIATNEPAALTVAFIAFIAPGASMAFGRATAERTQVSFDFQHACTAGQALDMAITIKRPALSRNRIRMTFRFRNVLTGITTEVPVTLAPASGKVEHFHLPLDTSCCGRIEVSLESAQATDSLGFIDAPIEGVTLQSSYTVYPEIADIIAQTTRANRSSISGTTYDYHRKGQDRTEVFEMRDFQEGDSLKAVHWKLSARFDDLMVREPSRPTDYDITILCDPHKPSEGEAQVPVLNSVLAVTASISLSLIQQGLSHSVAYLEDSALESEFVDSRGAFNTMLDMLVSTPLPTTAFENTAAYDEFRRAHNVTRTVLVTDVLDENLASRLSQLTDLSVFHVSEGEQAGVGMDLSNGYALTNIPAESVGERIKNLEL